MGHPRRRSCHAPAAVDDDGGPLDEGGLVRGEEGHDGGHILGRAEHAGIDVFGARDTIGGFLVGWVAHSSRERRMGSR